MMKRIEDVPIARETQHPRTTHDLIHGILLGAKRDPVTVHEVFRKFFCIAPRSYVVYADGYVKDTITQRSDFYKDKDNGSFCIAW